MDLQRLLLDVSRSTASHRDLQSLLCDLVTRLQGAVHFDRLAVVVHDPARDVMRLHTLAAVHPLVPAVIELPPSDTPSGVARQTQQPVVVPSVDRETRFPDIIEFLRAEGMRSFCAFPLTSPLRRLGALGFSSREEDAFGSADLRAPDRQTPPTDVQTVGRFGIIADPRAPPSRSTGSRRGNRDVPCSQRRSPPLP